MSWAVDGQDGNGFELGKYFDDIASLNLPVCGGGSERKRGKGLSYLSKKKRAEMFSILNHFSLPLLHVRFFLMVC